MKTRDLIKLLQEADLIGEEHVCVDNADILDVVVDPAYYDGPLQVLERSAQNEIVSARFVRRGAKNPDSIPHDRRGSGLQSRPSRDSRRSAAEPATVGSCRALARSRS